MRQPEIMQMLEEIIREVDYDIYKDLFEPDYATEDSKETVERLIEIVEDHMI